MIILAIRFAVFVNCISIEITIQLNFDDRQILVWNISWATRDHVTSQCSRNVTSGFVTSWMWCIVTVSNSSSCAHAQVIRVAHSGSRSSCKVDLGFVGFLLSLLCFLRPPSGGLFRLRIFCCIRFYPSFGLFWGSPVGCVLGFLRFSCRICIGNLFHGFSCSLILSLASMLLPLVWHCIVFCLVYPCILV